VWGEVAVAGRSWRGSGVFARRERGGMGPGIGARGRLRPGGRACDQGARCRRWVPGGPGPVLELPTRDKVTQKEVCILCNKAGLKEADCCTYKKKSAAIVLPTRSTIVSSVSQIAGDYVT